MNALQSYFLHIETTEFWFYSMLFYTDLGYQEACETYAEDESGTDGGSYVQFALNITNLPLNVPLSFCLPKQCDNTKFFKPTMDKLTAMLDEMLALLKTKVNFDTLYDKVSDSRIDTQLLRQFTALAYNDTTI